MWWQELMKTLQEKQVANHTPKAMDCPTEEADAPNADPCTGLAASAETIILIRQDDKVLPLSQNSRLAVVGELSPNADCADHILAALTECFPSCIGYAPGLPDDSMINSAEMLASEAECVLLFLQVDSPSLSFSVDHTQKYLSKEQENLYQRICSKARKLVLVICTQIDSDIQAMDSCEAMMITGSNEKSRVDELLRCLSGNT